MLTTGKNFYHSHPIMRDLSHLKLILELQRNVMEYMKNFTSIIHIMEIFSMNMIRILHGINNIQKRGSMNFRFCLFLILFPVQMTAQVSNLEVDTILNRLKDYFKESIAPPRQKDRIRRNSIIVNSPLTYIAPGYVGDWHVTGGWPEDKNYPNEILILDSLYKCSDNAKKPKWLKAPSVASWFTGDIIKISNPVPYCCYEVGRNCTIMTFVKGKRTQWKDCIKRDATYYADERYGESRVDGDWTDDMRQEYLLLNHDLQRAYRQVVDTSIHVNKPLFFRFLVEIRPNNSYLLYVITPYTISNDEEKLIECLQRAIKLLPHDSLFPLYTVEGEFFPYRIWEACYNGIWYVRDYLHKTSPKIIADWSSLH